MDVKATLVFPLRRDKTHQALFWLSGGETLLLLPLVSPYVKMALDAPNPKKTDAGKDQSPPWSHCPKRLSCDVRQPTGFYCIFSNERSNAVTYNTYSYYRLRHLLPPLTCIRCIRHLFYWPSPTRLCPLLAGLTCYSNAPNSKLSVFPLQLRRKGKYCLDS